MTYQFEKWYKGKLATIIAGISDSSLKKLKIREPLKTSQVRGFTITFGIEA